MILKQQNINTITVQSSILDCSFYCDLLIDTFSNQIDDFSADCVADREEQEDSDGGGHGAPCAEHRGHLSCASVHKNTLFRALGTTIKSSLVFPMLSSTKAFGTSGKGLRPWFLGVPIAAWYWGYILVSWAPAKLL